MNRVRAWWVDYAVAVAAVAVATLVRLALGPRLGDSYPFLVYFGAVTVVAWFGRTPAAVFTLVLSGLVAVFLFIAPRSELGPAERTVPWGTGLFFMSAAAIVAMSHAMRQARRRAEDLLAEAVVRQDALRQSVLAEAEQRERLRTTLASIGDAVITTDTAGRVTNLNPVAESLTGWTNAAAVGHPLETVFRIVNEATRQPVENPATRALSAGVMVGLANHTVLIGKDGTERPIDDSAAPIRSAAGDVVGCVLVFRDITGRHRQEAGLRASEARFRELADAVPQIVYETDAGGRIGFANRQWREYTGQTEAQIADLGPVVHPDDLGHMVAQWEAARASGTALEAEFRLRRASDGAYRWFLTRSVPVRDDAGQVVKWFGTSTDIHEQKQTARRLAESEALYRAIGESIDFGVWVCDAEGRNSYASDSFLRMVGITQQECSDFGWGAVLHPDDADATIAAWKECVRTHGTWDREHRFKGSDGQWHHVLARGVPRRDAAGAVIGWAGINLDVTRLVQTEREVARLAAESERQRRLYETVLTNTPDFVYVFSLDHKVLYANDALITMWGRGHEGAIGKTFLEIGYEPWHAEMHDREIDQVRITRQPIRGEVPFNGTNGRRLYDYIFVPVIGADGEVEAVAGTTRDVTDRKEAERAVLAGEERLRTALTAARMVAWEWTPADRRLRVSDTAAEVLGLPAGVGLTGIDQGLALLHPDDVAAYQDTFQQAIANRTGYLTRFRVVRPDDGRVVWIEERGHTVFDQPDGGVRLFGVAMDVTDRHEAEADRERLLLEVEGERRRLADAFRQAPAFMCVLRGADHVFEVANDRYYTLVGQRDLLGKTVREVLPEAEEQGFIRLLDGVYRTGEPVVGTGVRLQFDQVGEKYVDFLYQPLRDPDGAVAGVVVVGVDVTGRHAADEALRLSEERFRALFETMDEGFCVIEMEFDAKGRAIDYRIELMNPAFEKHTGMHGLTGQSIRRAIPALEDFWYETYGRVASTGEPARFVHQAGPMGGRWFDVSAFRLGGAFGNKVAILFNDISDRKLAEAERERLVSQLRDQDRRKDEFLATLAHELRNPLAPIRTGLQLIRLAGADGTVEQVRSMMDRQLGQMTRLVDDLLDVSRVTSGKLQLRTKRIELRAVIDAAVETSRPVIEQSGHDLAVVVPDEPIFVDGDPIRLAQVVSNLLANSARYTHRGGHIRVVLARDGAAAVVTVADDGIGIPAPMLEAVFDMFTQVDRTLEKTTGGLGIGLSLVKGLVEMHGGTIEARSEGEGRGSEFVVRVPITASVVAESEPASAEPTAVVPSELRRVLVLDDNVDAADALAQLVGLLGNEVHTAYDGEAGIEAAKALRPGVVLCDIGMPKVNGYNVARRIRAEDWGRSVVLVALTGWGQESDRLKSADAGFDYHLVKPVDDTALMKLLDAVPHTGSAPRRPSP